MPCLDGWMLLDGGPRLRVECDFGSGWVNVTPWLRGLSVERGRRGTNDRFDAGTAQVEFDNRDARFSTYSAIYGATRPVKVGNRLRVLVRSGSLQRAIFTGWVDSWDERGDTAADLDAMTATCFDGWERLARAGHAVLSTPVGAGESGDARVNRILDAAGWFGGRAIQPAAVTMQGTTFAGGLLDELHDVALSESGELFVDGTGTVRFLSKATVVAGRPPVATLSNDCRSGLPFVSIDMRSSTDGVINTAYIAAKDTATQAAVNDPSVTRYGQRVFSATDLLHETTDQSAAAAAHIVAVSANADFAVTAVDVYPATGKNRGERDGLWRLIASAELVDRLNIIFVPEHASERAQWLAPIDGLRLDATPASASISYRLGAIGTIAAPEIIAPPYDLHEISVTGGQIVWVWTNGAAYDEVLVRISGPGYPSYPWQSLPGGATTWTLSTAQAEQTYTLCVKGRAGLVETDEVCDDATAGATLPGPSDEGCFQIPVPHDVLHCSFTYELDHTSVTTGETTTSTGTVPSSAYGTCWRPDIVYVPGDIYKLCITQVCDVTIPPEDYEGDEQCGTPWEEPDDWADGCEFPEQLAGNPISHVEVCAQFATVVDIMSTGQVPLTKGPAFGVPGFGPYPDTGGPADVLASAYGTLVGPVNVPALEKLVTLRDPHNTQPPFVTGEDIVQHAGMTVAWWQLGIPDSGDSQATYTLGDKFVITESLPVAATAGDITVEASTNDGLTSIYEFPGVLAAGTGTTGDADILNEPFNDTDDWVSETTSGGIVPGRTGTALAITNGGKWRYEITGGSTTITVGFACKLSVLPTSFQQIVELRMGSPTGLIDGSIRVLADGSLEYRRGTTAPLGATAAGLVAANTWFYFELRVFHKNLIAGVGGTVVMKVNDVEVLNLSNVDTNNGFLDTDTYKAVAVDGINDQTTWFDDLYIDNGGPFLGDHPIGGLAAAWHHYAVAYGWQAATDERVCKLWVDGVPEASGGYILPSIFLLDEHGSGLAMGATANDRYAQWTTWDRVLTDAEVTAAMGPGAAPADWPAYVASLHPTWYVPAVDGDGDPAIDLLGLGAATLAGTGDTPGPFGETATPTNVSTTGASHSAVLSGAWPPNGGRTYQLVAKLPAAGTEWTFQAFYAMALDEYVKRRTDGDLELRTIFPDETTLATETTPTLPTDWELLHLVVKSTSFELWIGNIQATFPVDLDAVASATGWYFEFGPIPDGCTHVAIYDREFTETAVLNALAMFDSLS